jgi:hypothetical protein
VREIVGRAPSNLQIRHPHKWPHCAGSQRRERHRWPCWTCGAVRRQGPAAPIAAIGRFGPVAFRSASPQDEGRAYRGVHDCGLCPDQPVSDGGGDRWLHVVQAERAAKSCRNPRARTTRLFTSRRSNHDELRRPDEGRAGPGSDRGRGGGDWHNRRRRHCSSARTSRHLRRPSERPLRRSQHDQSDARRHDRRQPDLRCALAGQHEGGETVRFDGVELDGTRVPIGLARQPLLDVLKVERGVDGAG